MSLDTLGRNAATSLRRHTDDLDVEASLARTFDGPHRTGRRTKAAVAALAVAVVLVMTWLVGADVLRTSSAPPAGGPDRPSVGRELAAPVEMTVPSGWEIVRDDEVVVLAPSDGSPEQITITVPTQVYDPLTSEVVDLRDDLVVWTTTHPDLRTTRWALETAPGTAMTVSVAPGAGRSSVPLVPLPSAGGPTPLAVTTDDATFRWDLVYFAGSPTMVIAASSPFADDITVMSARRQLLDSLVITPQPTSQESS